MLAAIVAVGSELLGTERLDTNSLRLTALFDRYGVELERKVVVGDLEAEISRVVGELIGRVDLIVMSGGLGPTSDDVTREGVARALGRSLTPDAEILRGLEERFSRLGWRMPDANRRQALVIDGATVVPNPVGSAPGLAIREDRTQIFLFPGVPRELDGMTVATLEPWIASHSGGIARERAVIKVAALPESTVEERIAPAYEEFGREAITILANGRGEVRLEAVATGSSAERSARLTAMVSRLTGLVGDAVFTTDADATLEQVVGSLLEQAGATIAVAESCTGGLLAERLTRTPGSSSTFLGGIVAYANTVKTEQLGVDPALLERHGAVSAEVAIAMAAGARERMGSTYALSTTGIAGPEGATADKPVGTVHLGLAGPDGLLEHRALRLPGGREGVRWMSTQLALEMMRRQLTRSALDTPWAPLHQLPQLPREGGR
jgi:nicotinamide-nucleotide amidase